VPECFRYGVIGEPGLIYLSSAIKGKQGITHDVRQSVEIGVGKTSLALQGSAGALIGRAEKLRSLDAIHSAFEKISDTKSLVEAKDVMGLTEQHTAAKCVFRQSIYRFLEWFVTVANNLTAFGETPQ
jgi:hypothetical protein